MAMRLLVLGLVIVLLGFQLRMVDSFVLNEKASRFVAEKFRKDDPRDSLYPPLVASTGYDEYLLANLPGLAVSSARRTIRPPKWLAFSLMSVGAILVLGYPCFRK